MGRDWISFHNHYDTSPSLQARLLLVREQVGAGLAAAAAGPIRVLSLCAGDGRDLLGTLVDHPRTADVEALLVDNHAELVARGAASRLELGLPESVRFREADATLADTYLDHAPAELVIAAGVFGNLKMDSVQRLVVSLRCLCKTDGRVVWTHKTNGKNSEYRIALLREMLQHADFRELTFTPTEPSGFAVATHVFVGAPAPLIPGARLFDFPAGDS